MKTTLKDLGAAFMQSASDEGLPMPMRRFAAKLAILTQHVHLTRVKTGSALDGIDERIAEITQHLLDLKPADTAPAAQPPSASGDAAPPDEEEEAAAMAAKVQEETAAEAAALRATATHTNGNGQPSQEASS